MTETLPPPASGITPSDSPVQPHEHSPPSTFSPRPTRHQEHRSLVTNQMSGPSPSSRCPPPASQHAPFETSSSRDGPSLSMAHCTLSGPSTAAALRRILYTPSSVHISTVFGNHRTDIDPTTAYFFSSPTSSALSKLPDRLACQPEPEFERDWPVPDDEVHYC